jgi:hypothetical protein
MRTPTSRPHVEGSGDCPHAGAVLRRQVRRAARNVWTNDIREVENEKT